MPSILPWGFQTIVDLQPSRNRLLGRGRFRSNRRKEPLLETCLYALRIGRAEPALFRETSVRPDGHLVVATQIAQLGEEPIAQLAEVSGPSIGLVGLAAMLRRGGGITLKYV